MRIERLEIRLLRLPLVRFFETSFGRIYDRPFLLVTLHDQGVQGVGECVADANPFYSPETTATAWPIISEFIAVGSSCFATEWGYAIAFLFFMVVIFIRPQGLFGGKS